MEKFKIICFVDNHEIVDCSKETTQKHVGLIRAFGSYYFDDPFCNRFLWKPEGAVFKTIFDESQRFLLISENRIDLKNEINKNDVWDMLLVHDSVSVQALHAQYPYLFTDHTIVLYHENASWKRNNLSEQQGDEKTLAKLPIKRFIKGQHEYSEDEYYIFLSDIADAYNGTAFDSEKYAAAFKKITNVLYQNKLEAALEFLHECLNKKPKLDNWEAFKKDAGLENDDKLDDYWKMFDKNTKETDLLSGKYIISLETLRDKLLKIAIEK